MLKKLSDSEATQIQHLVVQMAALREDRGYDFDHVWIQQKDWIVVPVEDTGHFAEEEINDIVSSLNSAGHFTCLAVGTPDLPPPLPRAYEMAVSVEDFRTFNAECGLFRFLLTDEKLLWAISCNEWFNLFAGPPALVEAMLGMSVAKARADFLDYARLVEGGAEKGKLVQAAEEYLIGNY